MDEMFKLSIVVPVYNTEKYLTECLDSLLNQTLKDIEIIIVNDCTKDTSEQIILEYANKDNRIKYIKHEENLGLGGARNTGIMVASAEWIAFVDSDDYLDKNCYKNMLKLINQCNADLGIFSVMHFYDDSREEYYDKFFDIVLENGSKVLSDNLADIPATAWNKIFRLSDIKNNNLKFPEYLKHEDEEFWFKYAAKVKPSVAVDSSCYYKYRQREGSITSNSTSRIDMVHIFNNVYDYWEKEGLAQEYKKTLFRLISYSFFWYNDLPNEKKEVFYIRMRNFLERIELSSDEWYKLDKRTSIFYIDKPIVRSTVLYALWDYDVLLNRLTKENGKEKKIIRYIFSIFDEEKYKVIRILGIKISISKRGKK